MNSLALRAPWAVDTVTELTVGELYFQRDPRGIQASQLPALCTYIVGAQCGSE